MCLMKAPINLDHDYCSTGPKPFKRHSRQTSKEEAVSTQPKAFCNNSYKYNKAKHGNDNVQTLSFAAIKSLTSR